MPFKRTEANAALMAAKKQARDQSAKTLKAKFYALLRTQRDVPLPDEEVMFAKLALKRAWRFDYAWVDQKVALECDGGVWTGGRHTRGAGWLKDQEKLNAAVTLGWRVLHVTPGQLATTETLHLIRSALNLPLSPSPLKPEPEK